MEKIIAIFGDSITWGAYDIEGGWANRLKQYLTERTEDYFEVYNLGISGDSTADLLNRIGVESEARNPNTIVIAIGANDASYIKSKSDNYVPMAEFKNNLIKIINEARNFTDEIIFVGLTRVDETKTVPVPWNPDICDTNESISAYDAEIKDICAEAGIPFIEMLDLIGDDDLDDGLHPNSIGHEKMFLRVKDFLLEKAII
jgi:lysophospholipase L1-like esterase